ncbi:MAG TPA: hypothetical protein VFN88_07850 [Caulobacteraceae bacterium]|nr:hypothetical protein [Caulobacteraceae bacterium]
MPSTKSAAKIAERLAQRRARVMLFQGILFIVWQANFLSSPHADFAQLRSVDQLKISAFIVWAVVLLIGIATGGALFRSKAVRELLNDESTRMHRRMAQASGFWAAMLAALSLYVLSMFTQVRLVEAIHIVLSAGIGGVLVRFAQLERRALGG